MEGSEMNRAARRQVKHRTVAPAAPADTDKAFFADHADRNYRIRLPVGSEYENEFRSLGDHEYERRRVIVSRVPIGMAAMTGVRLMPIPFLAFADEDIADRDDILGPIFRGIMEQAGADMGLIGPARGW
jgi:hypothetical protein